MKMHEEAHRRLWERIYSLNSSYPVMESKELWEEFYKRYGGYNSDKRVSNADNGRTS